MQNIGPAFKSSKVLCLLIISVCFLFIGMLPVGASALEISLQPNDPDYSFSEPYFNQIGVPTVWDQTIGSRDVVVAVLDSGVDIDHADLKDNMWHNTKERLNGLDDDGNGFIDDLNGWDFVGDDNGVSPDTAKRFDNGGIHHGTVVAGLVGAVGNNSTDSTGVSMRVQIMSVKVMDNHGRGEVQDVISGIDYAIQNGADIINLSFSGPESSQYLQDAMRKAHAAGVIVVVAAGNDNDEAESGNLDRNAKYPVCTDKGSAIDAVVGVGAVDINDKLSDFSNYGSCLDLVAPGEDIVSTLYHEPGTRFESTFGGYFSGTSLAAPLVSGSAALLMSLHPDWTSEEVVMALYLTADSVDTANPGLQGKLGNGRLNTLRASRVLFEEVSVTIPHVPSGMIIVGPASGGSGDIRILDTDNKLKSTIQPFGNTGEGLNFATGDLDGDGSTEIVLARNGLLHIFDTQGVKQKSFPLRSKLTSPVSIAIGDLQGDGDKEIIVTHEKGTQTIWLYTKEGYDLGQFDVQGEPLDGLRVAVGDVTNDGAVEIFAGTTGLSRDADVWVYLSDGNNYAGFQAFVDGEDIIHSQGIELAVADLDGDGTAEVIAGPSAGQTTVRTFTFFGALISEFDAFSNETGSGVYLSVGDYESDGNYEIVASPGPGGRPHVKMFDTYGSLKTEWMPYPESFRGGVTAHFEKK